MWRHNAYTLHLIHMFPALLLQRNVICFWRHNHACNTFSPALRSYVMGRYTMVTFQVTLHYEYRSPSLIKTFITSHRSCEVNKVLPSKHRVYRSQHRTSFACSFLHMLFSVTIMSQLGDIRVVLLNGITIFLLSSMYFQIILFLHLLVWVINKGLQGRS